MANTQIDQTADEMQVYLDAIEAHRDPDDSEIEAYARMKNRVQADRDALIAKFEREQEALGVNYAAMMGEIDRHDKAIEWKYGQMVSQLVSAKIKGMKQRSVKTLFGTVGYRKSAAKTTRNIRCDNATLLAWAEEHCPQAVVSRTSKVVSKGELPETCEHIWIEDTPATDNFYWKPAKVQEKNDDK